MGYKQTAPVDRTAVVTDSVDDGIFAALRTAERHLRPNAPLFAATGVRMCPRRFTGMDDDRQRVLRALWAQHRGLNTENVRNYPARIGQSMPVLIRLTWCEP